MLTFWSFCMPPLYFEVLICRRLSDLVVRYLRCLLGQQSESCIIVDGIWKRRRWSSHKAESGLGRSTVHGNRFESLERIMCRTATCACDENVLSCVDITELAMDSNIRQISHIVRSSHHGSEDLASLFDLGVFSDFLKSQCAAFNLPLHLMFQANLANGHYELQDLASARGCVGAILYF
jgi:hypothetical protein